MYTARVLGRIAAAIFCGSVASTKVTSIPSRLNVWPNSVIVPPYSAAAETMCPPAWTRLNSATAIACCPLDRAKAADAAVQGRHPLLEHVGRGVHQPRVDPAQLLQGEQVGGVFGALEHVAGGLMDGHGPRAGRRVGRLPGV